MKNCMNFILKCVACSVLLLPLSCGVQSTPAGPMSEPTSSQAQALTTLNWSGYTWNVKQCTGCGPGPNNFDSSTSTVWVDSTGSLNLSVHKSGGKWFCGEVSLPTG